MILSEFFFVGFILQIARSNYNTNAPIDDCNGPESDQLSDNKCFCYDGPENDMDYSICKDVSGPSGVIMYCTYQVLPYFILVNAFLMSHSLSWNCIVCVYPRTSKDVLCLAGILKTVFKRIWKSCKVINTERQKGQVLLGMPK